MNPQYTILKKLLACCAFFALLCGAGYAQDDAFEINVIASMTGPGAAVGAGVQASLTGLQEIVNREGGVSGKLIHFTFLDDQTSPQIALQLTNAMRQKNVQAFLGPSFASTCNAVAPLLSAGPVAFCLSPSIYPAKNSNMFAAGQSNEDITLVAVRYFRTHGMKRIALLTTTDASGQTADNDFPRALKVPENRDLSIVAMEHFNAADVSVTAQLARIKAANPQVVVVWTPGTPFGTALRGLNDLGMTVPIITTGANMSVAVMKRYSAMLPRDLYFVGGGYLGGVAANPAVEAEERRYVAALKLHDVSLDEVSGLAWDPANIFIAAYRRLGLAATAGQIHAYIAVLHDFSGIRGVYDFREDQRGLGEKDLVVLRWDGTKGGWNAESGFGGVPLSKSRKAQLRRERSENI
jgi:branched-chain amino acid transport system substrate-binding protein